MASKLPAFPVKRGKSTLNLIFFIPFLKTDYPKVSQIKYFQGRAENLNMKFYKFSTTQLSNAKRYDTPTDHSRN